MTTQTEKLNKYIQVLKKHLEEKEETIIKLRKELSELKYVNANKKWAELVELKFMAEGQTKLI